MTLSRHHVVALIGSALTSAIALSDAVMHGVTGRNLLDATGPAVWLLAGDLAHGFTYAALSWVLVRESVRLDMANRLARAMRPVLIGSLWVLALGFILFDPLLQITKAPPDSALATAWGWIAGIGFAGMILSSLLLGIALLRNNPLGLGGRLLGLLVPVLAATVMLSFVAPSWAHPGYIETILSFGVALIGVRAAGSTRTQTERRNHQPNMTMT